MKLISEKLFICMTASALVAGLLPLTYASPASAIECVGRNQVVNGNLISTPYCEDNYLAKVARSYGVRASNSSIRNNPNLKAQACRVVRNDNRLAGICADEHRGNHWDN